MTATPRHWTGYLSPKFWPTWLGLGLMRGLSLLPLRVQFRLGRVLGRVLHRVLRTRRRVAGINIALCFPELDASQRAALVRSHFESIGIGVFEIATTWWASDRRLEGLATIDGIEHVQRALDKGKGAILVSAHFTTLEIGCRLLLMQVPFHPMYRQHENPLFEAVMRRSRERLADKAIGRHDVRELLRSLKQNHAVWYAPDQAHRGKGSIDVPFFAIPAPTNPGTSRLARISGAPVLPFFQQRLDDGSGYRLTVLPPLEDFPGENAHADAARINAVIERHVRAMPEQYLWIHRRFKGVEQDGRGVYGSATRR